MALVGKKMVEQMIKSKALVVISKSYCPFCHKVIFIFFVIRSASSSSYQIITLSH